MLGKLNMDEFAMGSSNETSAYGPVLSPWRRNDGGNAALTPGGSSGGSASAVAARLAPGVTGTDTGGSIRQPAAFTGITGIKPTYGRCSRWGIVAFASSLDQAGPMARDVRDCAILLEAMAGFDPKDSTSLELDVPGWEANLAADVRGKRIGIPKEYRIDGVPAEIDAVWEQGIAWLRDAGAEIVEVSLPHTKYALPAYYIIAPAEASSNLARYDGVRYGLRVQPAQGGLDDMYEATRAAGFGAEVKRRIMIGTYVLSAGYLRRLFQPGAEGPRPDRPRFRAGLGEVRPAAHPDRAVRRLRPGREERRSDRHVSERRLRGPRQPRRPPRHLGPRRPRRAGPAAGPPDHRQALGRAGRAQCGPGLRGTRRVHAQSGGLVVIAIRHREERSDAAIRSGGRGRLDCFAALAMTNGAAHV